MKNDGARKWNPKWKKMAMQSGMILADWALANAFLKSSRGVRPKTTIRLQHNIEPKPLFSRTAALLTGVGVGLGVGFFLAPMAGYRGRRNVVTFDPKKEVREAAPYDRVPATGTYVD